LSCLNKDKPRRAAGHRLTQSALGRRRLGRSGQLVGPGGVNLLGRLGNAGGGDALEACRFEHHASDFAQVRVVIYDENLGDGHQDSKNKAATIG